MIATTADRLRDAAGSSAMRPEHELHRYAVGGVTPRAVVVPDSVEAVAAVLAACTEEGWPVEPAGAATWLAAGRAPAQPPVLISTTALHRVREYEPADLVVGAEAGVSLADLQLELARNRQTILLDPPAAAESSLGAVAALASAGPLRAAHGTPRDMVLGAEVVTGDGRILNFGGRVVKNVAGYDIVRLLVGSAGTFGIITSLFLRLRATTERDTTFLLLLATPREACSAALDIRRRMEPDALELIDPTLARQLLPETARTEWAVLVRIRGSAAALDEGSARLREVAGPTVTSIPADAALAVWTGLGRAEAAAPLYIRMADLPNRLSETVLSAAHLTGSISASDNGNGWHFGVHGADGIVRVWPARLPDEATLRRLAKELPDFANDYVTRRGTVMWPVWPHASGVPCPAPAPPGVIELRLARELKARFDPAGVLAVGRHVSGL